MSELLVLKKIKTTILYKFFQQIARFCERKREWVIRSKKRVIHSFAHLSWMTWANRSQLLFCHEWPEQIAHGHSFVRSDLSDLLTVAHLSWVIWSNHSQLLTCSEQSERMSEWANSRPCNDHCLPPASWSLGDDLNGKEKMWCRIDHANLD